MFLDLRDDCSPVPPPSPLPKSGKSPDRKRGRRLAGLLVVVNLGLLGSIPVLGIVAVNAVIALIAAPHR